MASVLEATFLQNETAAYAKLESIVWPTGPVCPHCGCAEKMGLMGGNATRPGLYKCYSCRKQSRVTVGTVFESSHIKLHVWLQAAYLMCSSKKGVSSQRLQRTLGVTLKTAWFMSHRLREAIADHGALPIKGGGGSLVEFDETFIGAKESATVQRSYRHRNAVLSLVERRPQGANMRSFQVDLTSPTDLPPIIHANIAAETRIMAGEAQQYTELSTHLVGHEFTMRGAKEYVRGEYVRGAVHINPAKGHHSLFKRGIKGINQHCSEKHLRRSVAEFDLHNDNRNRLNIHNLARTRNALSSMVGRRFTYRDSSSGAA